MAAIAQSAVLGVPPVAGKVAVRDLPSHVGDRVAVCGWVRTLRSAKTVRFVVVRDRTGTVQAVHRGPAAEIEGLTPESAVRVVGTVKENAVAARYGAIEIELEELEVLASADRPLPFDAHHPKSDTRLDHRYLDLRRREAFLVFEVQTTLEAALRSFLLARGFVEIHTPKITAGGSESGAEVFELPYFGATACLAQSPQFYMQLAMAAGFDRAFEVGPAFRAEAGITNRHAAEFTSIDVEVAWIDSCDELMTCEEELVRHALGEVVAAHGPDIERYCGVTVDLPDGPFPRIPLRLARDVTRRAGASTSRLSHRAEQDLSKYASGEFGHSFIFVTDYPAEDRPFYTMRDDRSGESHSFDLIWRGIEVTSGCQREHRYDRLRLQAAAAGIEGEVARYLDAYYFDMFRYGCPPHGGFGIGLNRLLMAMLAQPSIRETSFLFRGPGRFVP